MANFPTITYSNVKHKVDLGSSAPASSKIVSGAIQVKDEDITIVFNGGNGNSYRASYNAPYNQVTGTFTANKELNRFEIRATPVETADYGPGIGKLAYVATGISANTATNFSFNITATTFTGSSSNTYRICLLAQSSTDYSWDSTEVYMVLVNTSGTTRENFVTTTNGDYEVHHDTQI